MDIMAKLDSSSDVDEEEQELEPWEDEEEEVNRVVTFSPRVSLETETTVTGLRTEDAPAINGVCRSPSKPTYSLLGTRLRWVNIAQLLGCPLSPPASPIGSTPVNEEPLLALEAPPQYAAAVGRLSAETTSASERLCHRNQTDQTSHFSFISAVVNFTLNAEARTRPPRSVQHRVDVNRKLRSDDDIYSSTPEVARRSLASDDTHSDVDRRFVSTFDIDMPVPETFSSSWSIKHDPFLHMSSPLVKKLLLEKDLNRDDNDNIQEITETEVPASRLYSGLKNGNGVYHTEDDESEELPQRPVQDNLHYSESVSITRVPATQEYREGVHYDIDDSRRYRDEVRLVPGQPDPGRYYSTVTECFINSPYRRHKETVYITLGAPSPKQYTTSIFIFPKTCRETFVTEVEHRPEETIKWYRVGVTMEAKDYVSVKFMQINGD